MKSARALSLAALLSASNSQAVVFKVMGERAGYWDLSIFANYVDGHTLEYGGEAYGATDDDWGWGIGIHYNVDNHWNLGLDMAWNTPDYTVKLLDPETSEALLIDHTASRFDGQFNLQYNLLKGPITPFLQAGLGWTYMDSNIVKDLSYYCGGYYYPYCRAYANTFNETSFSYNLGLGLRWDVTEAVFIRGAYIQQWIDADGSPAPATGRLEIGFMH